MGAFQLAEELLVYPKTKSCRFVQGIGLSFGVRRGFPQGGPLGAKIGMEKKDTINSRAVGRQCVPTPGRLKCLIDWKDGFWHEQEGTKGSRPFSVRLPLSEQG